MTGFILVESQEDKVPDMLRREVQGFATCPELERLDEVEREMPGLVCAALTRFLERLQEAEMREELSAKEAKSLDDAFRVIESLSRSDDLNVQNFVQTEIFENLNGSPDLCRRIESRFGPSATALQNDWRLRNGE